MKKNTNKSGNKRGLNPNSLSNLKPIDNSDPKIKEAQDIGKIEAQAKKNIRLCLETKLFKVKAVDLVVDDAVQNKNYRALIELIKIAKGNEDQNINLNGGLEVQKVFIDEKTKKQVDKHIDEFIDGK